MQPQLSKHRALTELKKDNTRVVLTVDKGVAMVIMDQQDYTNKGLALLQDTNTCKVLHNDPTPQLKNKLISLLKDIKQTGGLTTQKYKQIYPTSAVPTKFYGLPKIHKTGTPSDPLYPVGGPSHMVLPRSFHTSSNLLLANPHIILKTHNTSSNSSKAKGWNQGKSSPHMM